MQTYVKILKFSFAEENYSEKLRLLREAAHIPMERWRAPTVQAWIEIALSMSQYGARCAENIKSGKVVIDFICDVNIKGKKTKTNAAGVLIFLFA